MGPFFFRVQFHLMDVPHCVYSPMQGHLRCFQFGAITDKDPINISIHLVCTRLLVCVCVCVNLDFHFTLVARSYGECIFNVMRNCQTVV